VDETGFSVDGHQAWLRKFHTAETTVFTLRVSRGRKVIGKIFGLV
jgi:hypothetical protein